MKRPAVVAVDWGTSSFRLWVLDRQGKVLGERRGAQGMSTLEPSDFESVLEAALGSLGVDAEVPAVVCGMAGAARGWCEAAYADVPIELASLSEGAVRVPGARRDVRILPGLAQRVEAAPDVMRGEETILLGAVLERHVDGTVCMPGTHSKWARVEAGSVTRFSTAMTGELFALLASRSTLSPFVADERANVDDGLVYENAVREALAAPARLSRALFSVRAMPLLQGPAVARDMAARLSGLLIGLELAGTGAIEGERVTLIAHGTLARRYARAFRVAGIACDELDADEMARAGLLAAARSLWRTERFATENRR